MNTQPRIVVKPLIIVYRTESGGIACEIWPPEDDPDYGFELYGLIIADVIRHAARAFGVPEQSVFDWVKKEMKRPTTTFTGDTKQ
ncbi:MAG: hypothetical protein E6Q97_32505 [Desulfurellales bacterium]|nr:MAG: hypothetical protein E6Q97_32505 [Desulfurellales bacterium]